MPPGSSVQPRCDGLRMQLPRSSPGHCDWYFYLFSTAAACNSKQHELHTRDSRRPVLRHIGTLVYSRLEIYRAEDRLGTVEPHGLQIIILGKYVHSSLALEDHQFKPTLVDLIANAHRVAQW